MHGAAHDCPGARCPRWRGAFDAAHEQSAARLRNVFVRRRYGVRRADVPSAVAGFLSARLSTVCAVSVAAVGVTSQRTRYTSHIGQHTATTHTPNSTTATDSAAARLLRRPLPLEGQARRASCSAL